MNPSGVDRPACGEGGYRQRIEDLPMIKIERDECIVPIRILDIDEESVGCRHEGWKG